MCFSNFSQKTHQVLLWIGIHLVRQPSLVDRKSESATLLVLEKRWKCNCAYPQKVESARTNCSGFMSLLHVFLPLCTWRGKERQSLHFTWQSSISLTYTSALLLQFLVDWDIDPRSVWIAAPRWIPAQVAVGEELTWSYTNVLQPQAATLSKHLDTWMFKCTCPRWKTLSTEAVLTKKLKNRFLKPQKLENISYTDVD